MKIFIKYVITFIILILIFNILLLLSSLFPSSLIENHVKESSERLLIEGNHFQFINGSSLVNDNYTDSIIINECYSIDNTDPIFSYMSARKNFKKELTTNQLEDTHGELISISSNSTETNYEPVEELSEFLDGKVYTSIEYARYWHGYLPFFRVLLIFFNITELRIFLLILFLILFVTLTILLYKKLGAITSFIFAFSLLAYDYLFVSYSLESSPIYITMMLSCIFLLLFFEKFKNIYLYIFVIACISNFVDYLTVPLITLAMPLYIYLLLKHKQEKLEIKDELKIVINSCIIWGCGYAFTWITKWLIYDVLYHKNLIASAFSQVLYRSAPTNILIDGNIFDILTIFIFNNAQLFILFILLVAIILFTFYTKYRPCIKITSFCNYIKEMTPILLISILPIIWYLTLKNHSLLHTHFVYRHMLIFLTGNLIFFSQIFTVERK